MMPKILVVCSVVGNVRCLVYIVAVACTRISSHVCPVFSMYLCTCRARG